MFACENPGRVRLAQKALAQCRLNGDFGRQGLHGHRPLQRDVPGKEDGAHSAAAELALDQVGVAEGVLDVVAQGQAERAEHGGKRLPHHVGAEHAMQRP